VKNGWEFSTAHCCAIEKEPKVCAGDLLKSPLNLTDYFLLETSAKLSVQTGLVSILLIF
jgi:hypothetical protein